MHAGNARKRADVIDHWYALVPGFTTSSKEFYAAVEQELVERQVPGLEIHHVDFAEGGVLSQKREYLRMTRERLVFDICASPFGSSYFFSCRFAEIPATVKLWELCAVLLCALVITSIVFKIAGWLLGPFVLLAGLLFLVFILRNAVAIGLQDLDAALIKLPVVGPIYERWFRKETYYRDDTRLMYCDTVNTVVKTKVEETTGVKGIKLLRFNEYSPILAELYKPTLVSLPRDPS